jgi:preprotein translocase subunit SecG
MLHTLWITSSILLIIFIILHNPKSQGLGSQSQLFGTTRTAEENINKITWSLVSIFFILAIYISSSNKLT